MTNQAFVIIHKKRGMKNLVRKIIWMQAYNASSGIQKSEGRQWVESGSGKIKLAKLASVLEEFASWVTSKNIVITGHDGSKKGIEAGTRLSRPARPFIMLNKIPEIWNKLRMFCRKMVLNHLRNTSRNYKMGARDILLQLGNKAKKEQKGVITSMISKSNNKEYTQWQKGFDYPLFNSGRLESSIRDKLIPTASGKAQSDENKFKYLTQIDEMIQQLNGK